MVKLSFLQITGFSILFVADFSRYETLLYTEYYLRCVGHKSQHWESFCRAEFFHWNLLCDNCCKWNLISQTKRYCNMLF